MEFTTLCYLEKGEAYLMMYRVKKEKDVNRDKWIGIGGHFEQGESPEECLLREVLEETGLRLKSWRFRGIITFCFREDDPNNVPSQPMCDYMCLYTADSWEGSIQEECSEGELVWVPKAEIGSLNLWEGDRIFFDLLESGRPFFSLKLSYCGNHLEGAVLDGEELPLPWSQG